MTWQNPGAFALLAVLVLPVLAHLLSRAPATLRSFPSLRFIDRSRLSPRRRTRPRDLLLLLLRMAILAAAVTALAGPSIANDGGSTRLVRAIVLDSSASMARPVRGGGTMLDSARRIAAAITGAGGDDAASSLVVQTAAPSAALPSVVAWLGTQPGTHEIVILSDFQRGAVDSAALREVPQGVGLRLVRVDAADADSGVASFRMPAEHPATFVEVTARPEATEMRWRSDADTAASVPVSAAYRVTVHAGAAERAEVAGALAATLGDGAIGTVVHLDSAPAPRDGVRDVVIVYPGYSGHAALSSRATPASAAWIADVAFRVAGDDVLQALARSATGARVASGANDASGASGTNGAGRADSAFTPLVRAIDGSPVLLAAQDSAGGAARMLIFVQADAGSALSAALVSAVLRANAPQSLREREPVVTSDLALRGWSRPATDTARAASSATDPADSIGRWLWAAALLLLGAESLLRRAAPALVGEDAAA